MHPTAEVEAIVLAEAADIVTIVTTIIGVVVDQVATIVVTTAVEAVEEVVEEVAGEVVEVVEVAGVVAAITDKFYLVGRFHRRQQFSNLDSQKVGPSSEDPTDCFI